ncbi:hypothetical protein BOTBODRAFT_190579 [Botryobasidium botryosum FD-172 SS1]|uniref:Uncharacterized protein n=1 Tax=Botryobasidium botryosum (strain FD-172 SS1) TaxID=930990 RepID=A0A067MF75_BOTB1|nr:hypothetical protein BOTBODRAFT_190579 [Botryobasidium botryosum FD-172 SS1]
MTDNPSQPSPSPADSLQPPSATSACSKCGTVNQWVFCSGLTTPRNWGRWYQRCSKCNAWHWWPREPLDVEALPPDVQYRMAVEQSLQTANAKEKGIVCGNPGCHGKRKSKPQRGNVACLSDPKLCGTCCQSNGGCGLAAHAPVKTARPSPIQQKSFARPPTPAFSQSFTNSVLHASPPQNPLKRKYQSDDSADDGCTVDFHIWNKGRSEPIKFRVPHSRGARFILKAQIEYLKLRDVHLPDGLIEYYDPLARDWINMPITIGVDTKSSKVLYFRVPGVSDGVGFPSRGDRATSATPDPVKVAPPVNSHLMQTPYAPGTKFPLTYTCDMAPAMRHMIDAMKSYREDNTCLKAELAKAFPGIDIKLATFYRHRNHFAKADKAGIVEAFERAGWSAGGKWADLVAAVERLNRARSLSLSLSPSSPPPPSPSPSIPEIVAMHAVLQRVWRTFDDGTAGCEYYEDHLFDAFITTPPIIVGSRKDIFSASFDTTGHGPEVNCLAKQFRLTDDLIHHADQNNFEKSFGNAVSFSIRDAASFYGGDTALIKFHQFAYNQDVEIYNIMFANTFLLECPSVDGAGPVWLCQDIIPATTKLWSEHANIPTRPSSKDNTFLSSIIFKAC